MIDAHQQIAAIDLGSNSFHLVVARIGNNQPHMLDTIKEMVRLAAGLDEQNVLTEDKMQEALDCLSRFGQRLKDLPQGNVIAAGTNTLRKAKNSAYFLARAEQALGFPIQIIAGREEARLVYQGVAHSVEQTEDFRLVIDIGGGSTEFIIGHSYHPVLTESLGMGCVSFTRKWFADDIINENNMQLAIIAARQELEWIAGEYIKHSWQEVLGSSGTIKTIASILHENFNAQGEIDYLNLQKLSRLMIQQGRIKKLEIEGLSEHRAPVIVGGLCILIGAFEELKIETMQASEGALREGLLYDMIETASGHDIRHDAISSLKDRYQVDKNQAGRIRKVALSFYDQMHLPKDHELRDLLQWACDTHEVGLSISHSNYPAHGGYIIEQSDLAGFSREMQNTLGLMLRLQRGKLKFEMIEELPRAHKDIVIVVILLRLSILLVRSRDWDSVSNIEIMQHEKALSLIFPEDYLETHPLTRADLLQEKKQLEKGGYRLEYEWSTDSLH